MKLNQLSVIFIIIILPMSLILSTYIGNLVDVSNQLAQYDALVLNATYDAVKALEMNDLNDKYNLQTISLERNIAGSVNSFFDSFANGVGQTGYTKEEIKTYVPVMLYTMYDGFYLYGPHENVKVSPSTYDIKLETGYKKLGDYGSFNCEYYIEDSINETGDVVEDIYYVVVRAFVNGKWSNEYNRKYYNKAYGVHSIGDEVKGEEGKVTYNGSVMKYLFSDTNIVEQQYGIKPYTHYTCRYKDGNPDISGYDITVNYSLDNYISIHGMKDGKSIDESGYLINTSSFSTESDGTIKVKGATIDREELKENIISRVAHMAVESSGEGTRYVNYTSEPKSINGKNYDTITREYPYIVYNNIKYYLDIYDDDYDGKFNYVYDTVNKINVSFSDTYVGYPIFRLDESKNVNTRVYVNRSEMQSIVDFLNKCPLSHNTGDKDLKTEDFYLLRTNRTNTSDDNASSDNEGYCDFYIDIQGGDKKKSIFDNEDYLNSNPAFENKRFLLYESRDGRLNKIKSKFKDVNAWIYYNNAKIFTDGGTYKDKDGDNIDDNWMGAKNALSGIKKGNAVSNIFNQEYKVVSGGTGEVIEIKNDEDGSVSEYISSHDLYVSEEDTELFNFDDDDPEQSDSIFNRHRMDVIIKTVEYNLVNSIANYKRYVTGSGINTDFDYQMPTLSPNEWDVIANEISVLTFIQGLPVKRYRYFSNYALVSSTKNNLFVSRNSIYVTNNDNSNPSYHDPRCGELYKKNDNGTQKESSYKADNFVGYQNVDFDQTFKSGAYEVGADYPLRSNNETYYYYRQGAQADYDCAVMKNDSVLTIDQVTSNDDSGISSINGNGVIYYPKDTTNGSNARTAYMRALARRKYALYTARNPEDSKVQTN